jgi:3-methyl-2-oxobutanoate hydroxymethyltransferase
MTYQVSPEQALQNAGRLLAEGGAQAVKLEGGAAMAPTITRLVTAGIPVMAHLGLTPQSVHQLGGYRAQGKTADAARQLIADASAVEDAGAFALVLEVVPSELAAEITRALTIPTIGIGSGPHCDGQVQVVNDILGMSSDYLPRHARAYADLASTVRHAAADYLADVTSGAFPTDAQTIHLKQPLQNLLADVPQP